MNELLWFIVFVVIGIVCFLVGYWNCCLKIINALDSALEYEHSSKDKQYREGWLEGISHIINQFKWKV